MGLFKSVIANGTYKNRAPGWQRVLMLWLLAVCTGLAVIFLRFPLSGVFADGGIGRVAAASPEAASLPAAKVHPLPEMLARWQDPDNSGDYFAEIKSVQVGYLVWSVLPVKVFVERTGPGFSSQWVEAVLQAVRDWSLYFPLEVVTDSQGADIEVWHRRPPLRISPNGEIDRARSAETTYQFYIRNSAKTPAILSHRYRILLSPQQSPLYIQAAARHELGHALGIWGHSPLATDTMYFSQVRNPPPISHRDLNTLKRVYQQPTSLGWPLN